jgi:hypothetical protein
MGVNEIIMPNFDDFIVFADESGDHGLISIDSHYPIFVIAFCIIKKKEYADLIVPELIKFKFNFFGHDNIILHEHDIRKAKGAFKILFNAEIRKSFYENLNIIMEKAPFKLIASVIKKISLKKKYITPDNPYNIAIGFGLERLFFYLKELGCKTGKTYIIFEGRGKKENNELELEFRRICAKNVTK